MNYGSELEKLIGEPVKSENSLGGGCIGNARKVETKSGRKLFVKSYPGGEKSIIQNEANGLIELGKAKAVRVPEVIASDSKYIVLEYIEQGRKSRNFSENFGRDFARMHKLHSEKFGFKENNYIGSNPQINQPLKDNWIDFYWEQRLVFQYKLAEKNGYANPELRQLFDRLEKVLPSILEGTEEKPSVLHGDLWGGNYMVDENGEAVIIDPAVYYGHREADLGMTALFGGFDANFYKAYNEEFPLPADWQYRIDLYKLYHVLNHLNLFGTGYYGQAVNIIRKYIK